MDKTRKIDTSLYRDPNTGRWLQRGGSRLGFPGEIDTSVAGETASDRAIRRDALTETLVPLDLLIQMPRPELRAFELLLDVLVSSRACRVTSEKGGRILCRITPFADVEILVEYMIRVRLGKPWNDDYESRSFWPSRDDPHLNCYIISIGDRFDYACIEVCLVNNSAGHFPVTDSIVSWALWANCGFPSPPGSFVRAYNEITGRALNGVFASADEYGGYEENEYGFRFPAYMTDDLGMEPFSELDWQASLWEESLMSSTRARRHSSRTCNVSVGSG